MRRAGNGDDPFSGARARLVNGDAGARVAADFTDPSSALADNRTSQLEPPEKPQKLFKNVSPQDLIFFFFFLNFPMEKNSKRNATTHVFRNGNLGSFSMAAIVFTENPFVMVHPEMRERWARERKE
jgi:hypothetical protein